MLEIISAARTIKTLCCLCQVNQCLQELSNEIMLGLPQYLINPKPSVSRPTIILKFAL